MMDAIFYIESFIAIKEACLKFNTKKIGGKTTRLPFTFIYTLELHLQLAILLIETQVQLLFQQKQGQ